MPEALTFDSGGVPCAATLYRPPQAGAAQPCVVMGHGFTGTQDQLARHAAGVAERDTETDPRRAAEIARAAPRGEVVTYPVGHFAIHEDPVRSRVLEDQARFLVRHLRPEAEPTGGG